ncbi:MAG: pilus assembly protein PilM [Candidatus Falkowbacteria bacterium]
MNKKSFGLDISDYSIEAVVLEETASGIGVSASGRITLEPGIVERGRIKDGEKLKKALAEVLAKAGLDPSESREWVFGLPESLVFTHVFAIENFNEREADKIMAQEIENAIPFRKSDLVYSYKTFAGASPGNKTTAFIAAAPKEEISEWRSFFEKAGQSAKIFDIESLAVFRGMFERYPEEPVCLVDIGAVTSLVSIFTSLGLTYSYIINAAGKNISYQLASGLDIGFTEAEKIKVEYGLSPRGDYPAAAGIIRNILEKIFKEIKNNIDYFNNEYGFPPVKDIIVTGGTSRLAGFSEYINTLDLGVHIRVGQPLYKSVGIEYVEAIGLAARALEDHWDKTDPSIPVPAAAVKSERSADLKVWLERARELAKTIRPIVTDRRHIVVALSLLSVLAGFYVFFDYFLGSVNRAAAPLPPASELRIETAITPAPATEIAATSSREIKIIIKNISSPLNVRQGPGTSFKVVGKAGAGETYAQLEEAEGWIKISLPGGGEGWVFGEYADKVE